MRPARWAETYLGLPWIDRGRTMAGADCWGLVKLVLAREAGITIDDWLIPADASDRVAATIRAEMTGTTWGHQVAGPRAAATFDVVVMRPTVGRLPLHLGVVAGHDCLLHSEIDTGAALTRLSGQLVASRLVSIHRHMTLVRTSP